MCNNYQNLLAAGLFLFLFSSGKAEEGAEVFSAEQLTNRMEMLYLENAKNYANLMRCEILSVSYSVENNVLTEKITRKNEIDGKIEYETAYHYPFLSRAGEVVYSWRVCCSDPNLHSVPRLAFLKTCDMSLRTKFDEEAFLEYIKAGNAVPGIVMPDPCLILETEKSESIPDERVARAESATKSSRDWCEVATGSLPYRPNSYHQKRYLLQATRTPFFQAPKNVYETWKEDEQLLKCFPELFQENEVSGQPSCGEDFFVNLWETPTSTLIQLEKMFPKSYSLDILPNIPSTIWEEIHLTRLTREFLEETEESEESKKCAEIVSFLQTRPIPQKIVMTYRLWWLNPEFRTPKMKPQYDLLLLPNLPEGWEAKLLKLNEKFREIRENALNE